MVSRHSPELAYEGEEFFCPVGFCFAFVQVEGEGVLVGRVGGLPVQELGGVRVLPRAVFCLQGGLGEYRVVAVGFKGYRKVHSEDGVPLEGEALLVAAPVSDFF